MFTKQTLYHCVSGFRVQCENPDVQFSWSDTMAAGHGIIKNIRSK